MEVVKKINGYEVYDDTARTNIGCTSDTYSSNSTYSIGDVVVYNNKLHKCKTNITNAEEWTAEHWQQICLRDLINGIVESGRNDNGEWIKYADGTMIVTQRFARTTTVKNPIGNSYFGYIGKFPDFPISFIDIPTISVTFNDNDIISVVPYNTTKNNASSNSAYAYAFPLMNYEKTITIYVTAIGRWK